MRIFTFIFCVFAPLFCSSCAQFSRTVESGRRQTRKIATAVSGSVENATSRVGKTTGPKRIVVEIDRQQAFFFRGQKVIGRSSISTGRKGFETPVGKYHVIQKDADHRSNLYGDYVDERNRIVKANVDTRKDARPNGTHFRGAQMPFFLRFTQAYGMHAGYVPRYRASHGCIRLPRSAAKRFFDTAEIGTPVLVKH